jgi:metal-responsive CopG/Arc/MetJ family transcriptional regulator
MTPVAKVAISLPEDLSEWIEAERIRRGVGRSEVIADALRAARQAAEEAARVARRLDSIDRLQGLLSPGDEEAGAET